MLFYIETLGCKVNMYESNFISETFIKKGFLKTEEIEKANVMILNTCSVTNTSDSKCMKVARSMRRKNKDAVFVICGCSVQNDVEIYKELQADILLGTKNKSKIVDMVNNYLKDKTVYDDIDLSLDYEFEDMSIENFNQTRAYIKIQDGCENYCSYCVIPFVRGKLRFKKYDEVLIEAKKLIENNYKEIVLTGIHTGSYIYEDKNLVDLINDLSNLEGLERIRLSSIEITELKEDFMNLLKNNKVLCDNLHIPLQAGSNEILKIMNRKYDLDFFRKIIADIRNIREDIYISTDVIVGHPYETEELFEKTLEFCKEIKFSKIHVFSYSDRNGTAASKMPNHVNQSDIKKRSTKLLELGKELEKEYNRKFIGSTLKVLIEEKKSDYTTGHTNNFLKIKCDKDFCKNEIYDVKIDINNIF